MASLAPVLFILGAGPKVGTAVAKRFLTEGYKVATASRSLNDEQKNENELNVRLDLSEPKDVPAAFTKVQNAFGAAPSVVIYNAATAHRKPADDPLTDVSLEDFNHDMSVNVSSVLVAASQAVTGFKTLPASVKKTFIFTGNALALMPLPPMLTFGMGKSASAHLIMSAAKAYEDQDFRFYYGDERLENGGPCMKGVDGPAHAEAYLHLAKSDKQEQWYYTFVKGSPDYVDFGAPKI